MPYSDLTKDGIAVIPKTYFSKTEKLDYFSKTLEFSDVNYQIASDEEQEYIFEIYSQILNYFEDDVWFQLTFETRRRDNEVFIKKLDIPDKMDDFDEIRREYSDILSHNESCGLISAMCFGCLPKADEKHGKRIAKAD